MNLDGKYEVAASGCWEWMGRLDRRGYGVLGTGRFAHRLAYETFNGPIQDGLTVDHICFNRRCLNPDHLQLLTRSENARRQRSALKTECVNGHPFDGVNTYFRTKGGRRACRACNRDSVRQYKQRKAAA